MTDYSQRLADYEAKSTNLDSDEVLETYKNIYQEDLVAIAQLAFNVYARQNPSIYCMKGAREKCIEQMQQVVLDALNTGTVDALGTMVGVNDFKKKTTTGMKTRGGK